jgi:hypothetical protein
MRRALCLQTRYLDAVEQERAKTTAFQYLNERWTFGDENLETSRWLILSKRPDDKKGKPRADLVPGGARSRLLKEVKSLTLWKSPNLHGHCQGLERCALGRTAPGAAQSARPTTATCSGTRSSRS